VEQHLVIIREQHAFNVTAVCGTPTTFW